MRNQEDEMLKKCLRQTMEQIQPDEETKKRMYLEIMRRASAAENAKTAAPGICAGRPVPVSVRRRCSAW